MNSRLIIGLCSTALLAFAVTATAPVSAQEKRTRSCETQWRDMTKDEKKGAKKKDWVADCEAKAGGKATTAPVTTPMTAPATAGGEPKGKPGRAAMIARERACGKEWREAKAAGKIEKGQTWPKYWSECNKRMKAQGM
jgi:hypothetical protein